MIEIVWFPYSHPQEITDLNTALRAARSETERWQLFFNLLPLWTTKRETETARQIFGRETLWKRGKPPHLDRRALNPAARKT